MVTFRQHVRYNDYPYVLRLMLRCMTSNYTANGSQKVFEQGAKLLLANLLFFFNCLATSGYVIFAKLALVHYDSLVVTAFSNVVAAIMFAIIVVPLTKYEFPGQETV